MILSLLMGLVLLGGCAWLSHEEYPDQCGRQVTHVNTKEDFLQDLEVFPCKRHSCKRHRTQYHWERSERSQP